MGPCELALASSRLASSVCSLCASPSLTTSGMYFGATKQTSMMRVRPADISVYPKIAWTCKRGEDPVNGWNTTNTDLGREHERLCMVGHGPTCQDDATQRMRIREQESGHSSTNMTAGTIDRCDLREHGTVTPAYTRTDLVVAGEVDTQDAASPPWKTKSESQYAMLTGVLRDIQRTPKILHDDQYTTAHRSKTDIRVLHVLDRPHGTAMFREGVDCVTIEISVSQQAVQHVPIPYDSA